MQARKQIKDKHEGCVIEAFVCWYNAQTAQRFSIVARPNPPDAVVQFEDTKLWIEHADVYRGPEEAREEYAYATLGESDYDHSERPIVEPDERTTIALLAILDKKLAKESYKEFFEKFGKGLLLLTERDPLFSESTMECIRERLREHNFSKDRGYFKEAYIGYRLSLRENLFFERIYPFR